MREAQNSPFDKTEPPVAEWRVGKNQKAQFTKMGNPDFGAPNF
jgi:hypothetical protein